jgi:hypothetical protein
VRGDKQKAAGKKERACGNRRKEGKKAAKEKEKRVGRLKKARTHSDGVPELEDPQVEAKKETKARKLIRK